MKALSLSEFCQEYSEWQTCKYLEFLGLDYDIHNYQFNVRTYTNHLNQPFTPEMIVEKFKGWDTTLMTQNSKNYTNYYGTISLDDDRIYIRGNFMKFTIQNTIPRTLSDFINDCQRAGIELEFKEQ